VPNSLWVDPRDSVGPYGVYTIDNAKLLGTLGFPELPDGSFFEDHWQYIGCELEVMWPEIKQSERCTQVKLDGLSVSLLQPFTDNYYHFRLQCMPRIKLVRQMFKDEEISHWIVPPMRWQFHRSLLAAAGIDPDKIVEASCNNEFIVDKLILPRIPGENHLTTKWACAYTAALVQPADDLGFGEKIFVDRGNGSGRRLVNEREVIAHLEKNGFKSVVMNELTIAEQASVFHNAKVIVGVHGAALTNLIHAPSNARVIELLPANYLTSCFQRLSLALNLNYQVIVGSEPRQMMKGYLRILRADLKIPIPQLMKALS
jgi:capsular polysaccharide biosynthesis protein